jgi:hypothetical protein
LRLFEARPAFEGEEQWIAGAGADKVTDAWRHVPDAGNSGCMKKSF